MSTLNWGDGGPMIKIFCNECNQTIETIQIIKPGTTEYLNRVYGQKIEHLCARCYIQHFRDVALAEARKKAAQLFK